MENNENKFQEQQAPLKNHDDAFVQVGKNGEPVIPNVVEQDEQEKQDEKTTTLDKR